MGLCSSQPQRRQVLHRQASHKALLSGLALKFPKVRRAMKNVKKVFESARVDMDVEFITADRLRPCLEALGASKMTEEEIHELFKTSDLDKSKEISWREFIIAVGVGFYLKTDKDSPEAKQAPQFVENQAGFRVIEEAFKKIDVDNSGEVDAAELKEALFDVAGGSNSSEILEARFAELDFNADGSIEFPEFMYGFANWVGIVDDDEDDDSDSDEQELHNGELADEEEFKKQQAEQEAREAAQEDEDDDSNNNDN
eukprot:TRINITY_DN67520_c5_g3_i1.p1 TRINITY_DN67520_c5_g3~~TRINITY_DN67520_c5_g3_i1.p1  ORF type:complete len:255 (+),score=133.30 TRINITY_DN67520_c5_g3_i1:80-844(+)